MNDSIPILWRSPHSKYYDDETKNAARYYTPDVLADIRKNGFNAIWLWGKLWELGRSQAFPDLNDAAAPQRIASLQQVIRNAREQGIKVFLYFNEPLALAEDHPFWKSHPDLAGEPHPDFETGATLLAFCPSAPRFRALFTEAVEHLFADLPGLGGVILITASENHTHCWSHRSKRLVGDAYIDCGLQEQTCPRCHDREPADVVAELTTIWKEQADTLTEKPEVWVWNWSWSMWYEQPQAEVVSRLPDGVKLLCDFERGAIRTQQIGDVFIDEYSLGFVGPGERLLQSKAVADRQGIQTCAKLQIGTTHELATVPNIPLIGNLFDKLIQAEKLDLSGLMCSWNFGNSLTANTALFEFFLRHPELRRCRNTFLTQFAAEYFGLTPEAETLCILQAWEHFQRAFAEYPFSIPMLYHSPMNYAPALKLSFHFAGRKMGPSWIPHRPWGDDLKNCLTPFTIEQVTTAFAIMRDAWQTGLALYTKTLTPHENPRGTTVQRHCFEERSCAAMIGCHLDAMHNICAFQKWRDRRIQTYKLTAPCKIPPNREGLDIVERQRATARRAALLLEADPRLGYHQEPHAQFFSATDC